MLDAVVSKITTEIAIEGPKGVSRDELWELVQEVTTNVIKNNLNNDTIQPAVDDAYKRFLWPFIVKLPEINYFEDTTQPMDLDSEQTPADSQSEHPQEETVQVEITPESQAPATQNAKETTKKRKAPKKQPAKKKKPKKKPAARKKKAEDDDDYSSDEFQPDEDEESEEESDFDVDAEEESSEEGPEDVDDELPAASKNSGSENPPIKSIDTSGYRPIKDIHMLSYDEVGQRYGSRLRLVANEELQNKQIYVGLPPGRPLSLNVQVILGVIMRTRYNGLTQVDITKELDLDPRSAGHYVKSLEQRGAIIRKPIVTKGCRTNLCIHIRYNHDETIRKKSAEAKENGKYNARNVTLNGVIYSTKMLRKAVVALLTDAPDNVMYSYDILSALGFNPKDFFVKKWYYRSLESLCSKNVCRKLKPPTQGARTSRLLQLVDPNHASKENTSLEYNPTVDEDRQLKGCAGMLLTTKDVERPIRKGLMYDLAIEPQLLGALYEAGVKGATQKDLQYTLRCSDSRSLYKSLEKLNNIPRNPNSTRFTICRNFEFEGRIRRYRYYTHQAYIKLTEGKDIEPTDPPNAPIKENELIEIDYRKGVQESKRRRSKKATSQPQKETKGQKKSPTPAKARPVQKTPRRAAARASTTDVEPSSKTAESQAESSQTIDPKANSVENDPIDSNMTEVADTLKPRSVSASTSTTLASIFLPRKRTRSQTSAIEENTVGSAQTSQAADDSADITTTAAEPPKRQRRAPVRKPAPKETDINEQQLIVPEVPKGRSKAPVEPAAEEETPPVATVRPSLTTTAAGPPKHRNLFDYFASNSRQSPSPAQESRARDTDARSTVPRSPGALYQRLVVSSLEETAGASESKETVEAILDKEIEELFAPDAGANVEVETETVNDSTIAAAAIPKDVANLSNVNTTTIPITADALGNNGQRIKLNKKERQAHVILNKSGIRSARHLQPTTDLNAYMVTRKKILLEMLQEHSILEFSKDTMGKFLDKYRVTYGDVKMIRSLDRKTLWRSVESLAEDGDAQIVTVESIGVSNKKIARYILVRSDMDVNGPEVKAFKYTIMRSRILNTPRTAANNFDQFEKNVERISERLARMEHANVNTMESSSSIKTRRLLGDVRQLRSNVKKAVELCETSVNKGSGNWLMIAVQYGFVGSKMIRVKLFHQYLLELLCRGGKGIDQEKRVIESASFVTNMTLGLSLQVIGFYENNAKLSSFIKDPNNLEIRLVDLPEDIMELIMSEKNKFRRRVRLLLGNLLILKLIEPTNMNGESCGPVQALDDAAPAYAFPGSVPIIDYWSSTRSVIREYRVETIADALIYWSELQCFCVTGSDKRPTNPASDSPQEDEMIRGLATARNWSTGYVYNREQRKTLNAYINKETGETPFRKTAACKDIARSLNMPEDMVITYFRRMEKAFMRKLDKPVIRALEYDGGKRRQLPNKKTRKFSRWSASSPSGFIFKKAEKGSTARRLLLAQKAKKSDGVVDQIDQNRQLYLDDASMLPTIDEDVNINSLKLHRTSIRHKWTLEEDELLVYSYVILKARAMRSYRRFYWNSLQEVIPNRSGQTCRNRFGKIKMLPRVADHISFLFSQWNVFYSEGLINGEIKDDDIYDMDKFDLLDHLAYFIKRVQTSKPNKIKYTDLPNSRDELESKYNVRTSTLEETKLFRYEDSFHNYTTLTQKYDVLCDHCIGFRGFELPMLDHIPESLVPEITEARRKIELLLVFIRMVLFTSDDMYDPFFSYGVLHQYPDELSKQAVDRMRATGQLVQAKPGNTPFRRLPGYPYRISDRYMSRMTTEIPEGFYLQANEYEKYLSSQGATKYSGDIVSSGMMGCILNLISCDKLNFAMYHENIQWMKHRLSLNRIRSLNEDVVNISFSLEAHDIKEATTKAESPEAENPVVQARIKELDEVSLSSFWLGICNEQRKEIRHVLMAIKDHLDRVKEDGATIIEIKESVLSKHPRTSDSAIRECIDILCTTSPQLVYQVGFNVHRYVLSPYISDWVVVTSNIRSPEPNDENILKLTEKLRAIRKSVIHPRMWNDVNGNISSSQVLQGCMAAVLGHVVLRPGIRERDIVRLFNESLTYVEVKDILEELLKCGALRKVVTDHKSATKVTLFSKRRIYSAADPSTISRNSQTCYMATSDFYKVQLGK